MDRWAALYLVACERLGDENRAGQLVLRARNEQQLMEWLQAYGPLPDVLPPADPDLLEQVTRLRQRSSRRQKMIKTWGAAALVGLVALGGFSLRSLVADADPSDPPALVQSEEGQQRLVIHRAEANPEGITIWWSLSARGLRSQPQMPQFEMIHPEMPGLEAAVQGTKVGKRLEGTAHFNWVLIEPEQIYLKATVGETAHQLQLQPDRSPLTAAENSWPIHKVSASTGLASTWSSWCRAPGTPWHHAPVPRRVKPLPAPAAAFRPTHLSTVHPPCVRRSRRPLANPSREKRPAPLRSRSGGRNPNHPTARPSTGGERPDPAAPPRGTGAPDQFRGQ